MMNQTTCCLAPPRIFRQNSVVTDFSKLHGKIAIFGGSFDPIHSTHLEIARKVSRFLELDAVVLIPAKQNPLKSSPPAPDQIRLDMIQVAIQWDKDIFVSPMEFGRTEVSYSINTVSEIKSQLNGDSTLFMIIGADCLKNLHRWHKVHELIASVQLIIVKRVGEKGISELYDDLRTNFSADEVRNLQKFELAMNFNENSSSGVRDDVAKGNLFSTPVPLGIKQQIFLHDLYRK